MFCSKCGKQINNDEKFCSGCGEIIENGNINKEKDSQPKLEMTSPFENASPHSSASGIQKQGSRLTFITAGLLLLLGISISLFFLLRGGNVHDESVVKSESTEVETTQASESFEVKPDTESSFGNQKGTLSSDKPEFSHNGVGIKLSQVDIDSDTEVSIQKVVVPKIAGELEVDAYDFNLASQEDINGVIEISIPYDPNKIENGMSPQDSLGAVYVNEKTKSFEPVSFSIDQQNSRIIISTTHLSPYGCFVIKGDKKRWAQITDVLPCYFSSDRLKDSYAGIIEESIENNMTPGKKAVDMGMTWTNDWMGFSGSLLTMQSLVYDSEFLKGLNEAFGNVGIAAAFLQAGVDLSKGDTKALSTNAFKNVMNITVGKLGSQALQVGFVGVFAIDYSLNKLADELITGRKDLYSEAHKLYYENDAKRTAKEWYKIIYNLQKSSKTTEELKKKIDDELEDYCYQFWEEDDSTIALYQGQAMKNFPMTGGGGLNEKVKEEIADNYKHMLLTTTLQPVFSQLEKKLKLEQEESARKALVEVKKELNKAVRFKIVEKIEDGETLKYSGYTVKLAPLSKEAEASQWSGVMNSSGTASTKFTILAHLLAGSPNMVELYKPGSKSPEASVKFVVKVPETTVYIEGGKKQETTKKQETVKNEEPVQKEYSWVLVEVKDYNAKEQLEQANKSTVYQNEVSYSQGSFNFRKTYIGKADNYYDPPKVNGECLGLQFKWSKPPQTIKKDEAVTLNLSASVTSNTQSFFSFSGSAGAFFDKEDITPGTITRGGIKFANKDGKNHFSIEKKNSYKSINETVSATPRSGSKPGDRMALMVTSYNGISVGTAYIYEWK